jgi:hypothetical protein
MITKEKLLEHGFEPVNAGAFYQIQIGKSLDEAYYLAVNTEGWMGIRLEGLHYIGLREDFNDWQEVVRLYKHLTGVNLKVVA